MSYKVSFGENRACSRFGMAKDTFEVGEKVVFKVPALSDADASVHTDDAKLAGEPNDGFHGQIYSFMMPEHDVKIEVNYTPNGMKQTNMSDSPMMSMMGAGMMGMDMAKAQTMMQGMPNNGGKA